MEDITLVLNRRLRNLWLIQGIGIGCIWGVTGLEKAGESPVERVRIHEMESKLGIYGAVETQRQAEEVLATTKWRKWMKEKGGK